MKGQKGITLVALVITIIVMLILVGVSVTVAINGGLFDKAREGKTGWEGSQSNEANAEFIKYQNVTGLNAINAAVSGTTSNN